MLRILVALAAGLLFGVGLTVSQMINPAKVIAFLDFTGDWDPSLAFVMGGAITVAAIGFALGKRRQAPVCAPEFAGPTKKALDGRLVLGATLFGTGWGLVGYCPGPALASLTFGGASTAVFLVAMLAGMAVVAAANTPLFRRPKSA
jgi:uncharacterized membrane protein YedE/YeeE